MGLSWQILSKKVRRASAGVVVFSRSMLDRHESFPKFLLGGRPGREIRKLLDILHGGSGPFVQMVCLPAEFL